MAQTRLLILAAVTFSAIVVIFALPRFPQDQAYHQFADQRQFLGISNCLDVVSNVPFLLVGGFALAFLLRRTHPGEKPPFIEPAERWPYAVFFLGVVFTSIGSAYYHLAPGDDRLIWDRVPMTIAFMAFLAAVVAERISITAGLRLLVPLVLLGIGAVAYWHVTELQGRGDLRPYAFVQAYPMLSVPLVMILFPPRYSRTGDLFTAVGIYVLAKVFELFDRQIFNYDRIVSGHTLKHLAAAFSAYWVLRMLRLRVPLPAQ